MYWKKSVELLRLCNTPPSIISPLPIFAISLFLISRDGFHFNDLPILFTGIIVTLLSNFGSNLWNHCNDLKEDMASGKKNVITSDITVKKTAIIISLLLYACSLLLTYYLSMQIGRPIFVFFSIWAFLTWWYSDNFILKKIIGFRLKEHYIGELITYGISCPSYTLSIWLIYSDLNAESILLAIAFFFFGLSGLLLKDLKDISGDRIAGLKTFGVVFLPSQLIRYSCWLMLLFFLVMINSFTFSLFNKGILIMLVPFIYYLKNTFFHLHRKNWMLDLGDLKALKSIGTSIQLSLVFLGFSAFF